MYFKIYIDNKREWRWTLYAANHLCVGDSGEGYYNEADCLKGIRLVMSTNSNTSVYK